MSIIIKATGNDSTDAVIRKFQKRVLLEKVVQEYRDMYVYKKKSELRQEARKERVRKIARARRLANQ